MSCLQQILFSKRSNKQSSKDHFQEQYIQNIKNNEDFEIGVGLQDLMQEVNMKSDQYTFSQKYKDPKIEREYQKKIHPDILHYSKAFLIQYLIITAIFYSFQTYKIASKGGQYPEYKWVSLLMVLFNLTILIHYKLCRKFKGLSLYFAEIQSILVMVSTLELTIMGNQEYATVDLIPVTAVLIQSVSLFSYNQTTLFLSYLLCWTYSFTRSYLWIDDIFRYLRWNAYMVAAFAFIYYFSRAFQQRQRDKYQKGHQQIQMLKLFHNLIKVYHDGIIITKNDQIVFYNKEVNNIFNIPQDSSSSHETNLSSNLKLEKQTQNYDQIQNKKVIIRDLMKTIYPQSDEALHATMQNTDDAQLNLQNLWDYVMGLFRQSVNVFQKLQINKQALEGIYFKYKPDQHQQQQVPLTSRANDKNDKDKFIVANENQIENNLQNEQKENNVKQKSKKLQVYSQPINVSNSNLILVTIRDVSSWLELEHSRSIINLKTIAFAQAAHEFRNPLNGIIASLDLLEGQIQPENRKYFDIAKNCSNLMLFLVRDILDLSQLEAKSFELNFSKRDPKAIIQDCISVLQFKAEGKGIGLFFAKNAVFPTSILTDANRLKQILINLISNAIKYTETGHVCINTDINKDQYLQITVEDTGVGMSAEQIEKLFVQFTKFTKNRNLNEEGVGLGLVISQNLAVALRGSIKVISEVGVGSKFILEIPTMQSQYMSTLQSNNIRSSENNDGLIHTSNIVVTVDDQDDQAFELIHLQKLIFQRIFPSNYKVSQFHESRRLRNQQFKKSSPQIPSLFQQEELINEDNSSQAKNSSSSYEHRSNKGQSSLSQQCDCPKILIVDDEPFNLMVLEGILQTITPLKVEKANNGKQALERIEENYNKICPNHQPIRLVILDQNMPVMNGMQCAQKIKEQQRSGLLKNQLNLVLFTGDEFVSENVMAQFDMVLKKPIEKSEFVDMLKHFQIL